MSKKLVYILAVFVAIVSCSTTKQHMKSVSSTDGIKHFSVNGVNFNMIWVDGGTFSMGAMPEHSHVVYSDALPVHQVILDGFYIAETEVTQELWEAVMGYNPSSIPDAHNPVESVTWNECLLFLEKINRITGQNFRLPTEAEWEYAARGGNKSKGYMYSGSDNIDEVAWYCEDFREHELTCYGETHPVKTKKPNELGLYDMTGNVSEFCQDCYVDKYNEEHENNPIVNFPDCEERVVRGGNWCSEPSACGVSGRAAVEESDPEHYAGLGLRLAL
ncbi:MAG: hypothetical protein F082_318 [bacterium F082]|nr:MAG: hypothetical protein F082_318 [bacterium F082]